MSTQKKKKLGTTTTSNTPSQMIPDFIPTGKAELEDVVKILNSYTNNSKEDDDENNNVSNGQRKKVYKRKKTDDAMLAESVSKIQKTNYNPIFKSTMRNNKPMISSDVNNDEDDEFGDIETVIPNYISESLYNEKSVDIILSDKAQRKTEELTTNDDDETSDLFIKENNIRELENKLKLPRLVNTLLSDNDKDDNNEEDEDEIMDIDEAITNTYDHPHQYSSQKIKETSKQQTKYVGTIKETPKQQTKYVGTSFLRKPLSVSESSVFSQSGNDVGGGNKILRYSSNEKTRIVDDINNIKKSGINPVSSLSSSSSSSSSSNIPDSNSNDHRINFFETSDSTNQSVLIQKIRTSVKDKLPISNITSTNMKMNNHAHINTLMSYWENLNRSLNIMGDNNDNNTLSSSSKNSLNYIKEHGNNINSTFKPYIPQLSRNYIMGFLRQPVTILGERPCVSGFENCKSVELCKDRKIEPFVLREFLLPKDLNIIGKYLKKHPEATTEEALKETGIKNSFCILCSRFVIHKIALARGGLLKNGPMIIIQNHSNIFGEEGEYTKECMVTHGPNFGGIINPVVRYDMTDYIYQKYDVYYKQSKVGNLTQIFSPDIGEDDGISEEKFNKLKLDFQKSLENKELRIDKLSNGRNNTNNNINDDDDDDEFLVRSVHGWVETGTIIYCGKNHDSLIEVSQPLSERNDILYGTLPMNSRLEKQWTGYVSTPSIGEFLGLLFGFDEMYDNIEEINWISIFNNYKKPTNFYIKHWYKTLIYEYLDEYNYTTPPSSSSSSSNTNNNNSEYDIKNDKNPKRQFMFSFWYPFSIENMKNEYIEFVAENDSHEILIRDNFNGHTFNNIESRFIMEANLPRKLFSDCIDYNLVTFPNYYYTNNGKSNIQKQDKNSKTKSNIQEGCQVQNTSNDRNVGISINGQSQFKVYRSGSFSKSTESGALPFQIDNMEFNFVPLVQNPKLTSRISDKIKLTNNDVVTDLLTNNHLVNRRQQHRNIRKSEKNTNNPSLFSNYKWNLYSIYKSGIVPNHVLLIYINDTITKWEKIYKRGIAYFLNNTLTIETLNNISFDALYRKPIKKASWMNKYNIYYNKTRMNIFKENEFRLAKDDDDTPYHHKIQSELLIWNKIYVSNDTFGAFPLCTSILKREVPNFIDFEELMENFKKTSNKKDTIIYKWLYKSSEDSDGDVVLNQQTLNDIKLVLGENTPFFKFIIEHKPYLDINQYFIFFCFIYEITFLSIITEQTRIYTGTIVEYIINNSRKTLKQNPNQKKRSLPIFTHNKQDDNVDTKERKYTKKLSSSSSSESHDDKVVNDNNQKSRMRTIVKACHDYLTCFLPLGQFFVEHIENIYKTRKMNNISPTIGKIPVDILFPYPERSLEWTDTPDVRKHLQQIKFCHRTINDDSNNAIVSLFEKSLPFRSQGRSIAKKLATACKKSESMFGLIYFIIRNTLLGTYPDDMVYKIEDIETQNSSSSSKHDYYNECNNMNTTNTTVPPIYRPSFGTLLFHYKAFFDERGKHDPDFYVKNVKNPLLKWISSDSKLCSVIVKEFLVALLTLQPQYIETQPSLNWKNLWHKTTAIGNIIRWTTENSVRNVYKSNNIVSKSSLLPNLQKKYSNLFSNHTCFNRIISKYPFMVRLYSEFKNANETLIIMSVQLEEQINTLKKVRRKLEIIKTKYEKEALLGGDTIIIDTLTEIDNKICKINEIIKTKQLAHYSLQFELSDETKKHIWMTLFGIKQSNLDKYPNNPNIPITPEDVREKGIFLFISDREVRILYRMMDLYNGNVSPKEINGLISSLSVVGFKTLLFVLEVIQILHSIQLISLDYHTTKKIDQAMRLRFNLTEDQELPNKAFHVYYTFCCRRIASFNSKIRNYGNDCIIYDPYRRSYVCGKKKLKKQQEFKLSSLVDDVQLDIARNTASENKMFSEDIKRFKEIIKSKNKQRKEETQEQNTTNNITSEIDLVENDNKNKINNDNFDDNDDDFRSTAPLSYIQIATKQLFNKSNGKKSSNKNYKETKPSDSNNYSDVHGDDSCFSFLVNKAKRKVARTIHRQNQLDCLKFPEVLTINIRGYMLIEGRPNKKKRMYLHCPKCGQLHKYKDEYWQNGKDYSCLHCWTENETFIAKCNYCKKCEIKRPDRASSILNPSCYSGGITSHVNNNNNTTQHAKKIKNNNENTMEIVPSSSSIDILGNEEVVNVDISHLFKSKREGGTKSHLYKFPELVISSREAISNIYRSEIMNSKLSGFGREYEKKYNLLVSGKGMSFEETDLWGSSANNDTVLDHEEEEQQIEDLENLFDDIEDDADNGNNENLEMCDNEDGEDHNWESYNNENFVEEENVYSGNTNNGRGKDFEFGFYNDNNNNDDNNDSSFQFDSENILNDVKKYTTKRRRKKMKGKKFPLTFTSLNSSTNSSGNWTNKVIHNRYDELSPLSIARENLMVEQRSEIQRLTERMLKFVRKGGRFIFIDIEQTRDDIYEIFHSFLTFYNIRQYRTKRTQRRLDEIGEIMILDVFSANNNLENQHTNNKKLFQKYLFDGGNGLSLLNLLNVVSLCDTHCPNMNSSVNSYDLATRKRKFIHNKTGIEKIKDNDMASQNDNLNNSNMKFNDVKTLWSYRMVLGNEYFRAIERKKLVMKHNRFIKVHVGPRSRSSRSLLYSSSTSSLSSSSSFSDNKGVIDVDRRRRMLDDMMIKSNLNKKMKMNNNNQTKRENRNDIRKMTPVLNPKKTKNEEGGRRKDNSNNNVDDNEKESDENNNTDDEETDDSSCNEKKKKTYKGKSTQSRIMEILRKRKTH